MKNRLTELRKKLKLSQKAFGEPLNLSQSSIAGYETGAICVTDRTLSDICRVYNVNPDWLKYGKGEMFFTKQNVDVELSTLTAQLIKSNDEWLKNCIIALLKLSPQSRIVFKNFIDEISRNTSINKNNIDDVKGDKI